MMTILDWFRDIFLFRRPQCKSCGHRRTLQYPPDCRECRLEKHILYRFSQTVYSQDTDSDYRHNPPK